MATKIYNIFLALATETWKIVSMNDDTTNDRMTVPPVPPSSDVERSMLNVECSDQPAAFPRRPGETPRAFGAFLAFFQLGQTRSLPAVADLLGENPGTVRNWSAKFDWSGRILAFNSGLLEAGARDQAALQLRQAADWNRRLHLCREQEWEASQKLISAAQCFLESFGDDDLRRMNLAQVSRALKISSAVARSAIAGAELPASPDSELSPVQQQLLAAVKHLYGQDSSSSSSSSASASAASPSPAPQQNTNNKSNSN
jgi:hypothetical protein